MWERKQKQKFRALFPWQHYISISLSAGVFALPKWSQTKLESNSPYRFYVLLINAIYTLLYCQIMAKMRKPIFLYLATWRNFPDNTIVPNFFKFVFVFGQGGWTFVCLNRNKRKLIPIFVKFIIIRQKRKNEPLLQTEHKKQQQTQDWETPDVLSPNHDDTAI